MEHTTANNPEDPTPEPGNSPMGCVKGCGLGYLGLVLVAGVGTTFVGVSYGWSELWWSVEWLHIVRSPHSGKMFIFIICWVPFRLTPDRPNLWAKSPDMPACQPV